MRDMPETEICPLLLSPNEHNHLRHYSDKRGGRVFRVQISAHRPDILTNVLVIFSVYPAKDRGNTANWATTASSHSTAIHQSPSTLTLRYVVTAKLYSAINYKISRTNKTQVPRRLTRFMLIHETTLRTAYSQTGVLQPSS